MVESSDQVRAIGGYFELADYAAEGCYPVDGVRLNTARNALEYMIRNIPDVSHVYLPLYTCEAVIQPFKRLSNVTYSFYHLNDRLEIAEPVILRKGEYIIANNYFGIMDAYIAGLAQKYGDRLIVDNAQALFSLTPPGIKAVYSARKFVGVADGGFAVGVGPDNALDYEIDDASEHDSHLLIRKEQGAEAGFKAYQQNECKLDDQPVRKMAHETEDILLHINYQPIITRRRANFEYLHRALRDYNHLAIPGLDTFVCPMVYPFYAEDTSLRQTLIEKKIYVAEYWPNLREWCKFGDLEYELATHIIPLPIDQRYGQEAMERILEIVL